MSDLFSRESIKEALQVWHDSKQLGEHPLGKLKVVESQRVASAYEPSVAGSGLALRQLLRQAIECLRPAEEQPDHLDKHWRAYFILTERYINGRKPAYIVERLAIGLRMYYREQNKALDRLANVLHEQELDYTSLNAEPVSEPSAVEPLPEPSAAEPLPEPSAVEPLSERRVPFLAPPRPSYELIGRDEALRGLKALLLPGGSLAISALNGLPGVGKTALAIELANDAQVLEHFPDGVLWAGLGTEPDVMTILAEWGAALGIPANEMARLSSLKQRAQTLYRSIGLRRLLLVVDDAWQSDAALALKVGGPNCAHLLTTRLPDIASDFAGHGAQTVHELSETDGLALLARFVPQVVANEPDDARALVRAVGGLPLALILMGKELQKVARRGKPRRLRQALNQLQETQKRLQLAQPFSPFEQQPSLLADVPLSLLASIEISDKGLDEAARHALRALSIYPPKPNTFSEEAALAVTDESEEVLDLLSDAGLLESSGAERYTLHKVICDYATLHHLTERQAFYRRASTYFADFVQRHGSSSEGYRRLDAEWSNIKQVLQWAVEQQEWSPLLTCIQGLTAPYLGVLGFMDARGYWQDATHFLEQALKGAITRNEPLPKASILSKLGAFALRQANLEGAKQHLEASHQMLSPSSPFSTDLALQRVYLCEFMAQLEMEGTPQAAQKWLEQGMAELDALKSDAATHHKGYFYVLLAMLNGRMGQFTEAIRAAEQGLALLPAFPSSAKIRALIILSNVFSFQGKLDKSIEYQKEGIQIAQELGDLRQLANLWSNMGLDEGNRGRFFVAVAHLQKALTLYQQMGSVNGERSIHNNLGLFYTVLGDDEPAYTHLSQAIDLAQAHDLLRGEAFSQTYLAHLLIHQNKLSDATTALNRAHELARQLELASLLPVILSWQAEIRHLQRQSDQALVLIEEALQAAKKGGYVLEEGVAWSIKGKILHAKQELDAAEAAHQASLQCLGQKYPYERAQSQLTLAQHDLMRHDLPTKRAKSLLTDALSTFERLGAKREIETTKRLLRSMS